MQPCTLLWRALLFAPTVTLLGACASYPERTKEALDQFRRGDFVQAEASFSDIDLVESEFLAGAEAGLVALTAGDWASALTHLHRAAEAAADIDERALVGAESLGEGLASWVVNDTARAYPGEGFERVYVHCGLALAYLAQGMLDDVFVEVRLANRLLEAEETLFEAEYGAGGFGHLLSAIAYELLGEPDQALVDYLRMEEKGVGTAVAGPALVRLGAQLGRSDELVRWRETYGEDEERPAGAASVVLLAGIGLGPRKVEDRIIVPTSEALIVVAGASFLARPQPVFRLRLRVGERVAESELVEDVAHVAAENLADRQAWQIAKSVARGALKHQLTAALDDQHGLAGLLLGALFTVFTERADLRSWTTLPDSWQAVRLFVPPGAHTLTLEAVGGGVAELGSFELEAGETMLVFARTLGRDLHAHTVGGRRLAASVGATP